MSGTDPADRTGPDEPVRPDQPVRPDAPARPDVPGTDGAPPSWQGAPGFSGVDPASVPPHAPLPGAPPYPPGTEPDRAAVTDRPATPGAVLPRCVAASAGWVAVALLLALFTGVGSWPLRGLALVVPWALASVALLFPARHGVGPGGLVALAFAPFWLVHAFLVGLLGW